MEKYDARPREFLKVGYEKQKISLRPCRGIRPEDTTKIWGMNKKIYVQDPDREQLIAPRKYFWEIFEIRKLDYQEEKT